MWSMVLVYSRLATIRWGMWLLLQPFPRRWWRRECFVPWLGLRIFQHSRLKIKNLKRLSLDASFYMTWNSIVKLYRKCICKLTWQRKNTWKNHHSKMYFLKNGDFSAIAILRQLICCRLQVVFSNAFYGQFFLKVSTRLSFLWFSRCYIECFSCWFFSRSCAICFFFWKLGRMLPRSTIVLQCFVFQDPYLPGCVLKKLLRFLSLGRCDEGLKRQHLYFSKRWKSLPPS